MIRSLTVFAALAFASPALAQSFYVPAPSPKAMVMQTVGLGEITVTYSSPGKRDREIWGSLVPYGELWRTGANAATTLETTVDVTVGGQEVPAGTYALFTIPGEDEWTVIVNKNPNQGGTGQYDEKLDQARFTVKPVEGPARERLTFLFVDATDEGVTLHLEWDGVAVPIPIAVDTVAQMDVGVQSYRTTMVRDLARAAQFHSRNGRNKKALTLIEESIAIDENWYNTWTKATILHELEEHRDALKALKQTQVLGRDDDSFSEFWQNRVTDAMAEWPKK